MASFQGCRRSGGSIETEQRVKWVLTVLNLLFIVAASYLVVDIFYTMAMGKLGPPPVLLPQVSPGATDPNREQGLQPLSHYKHITRRNLFKTPSAKIAAHPEPEPAKAIGDLDRTSLDIRLWGTVTGESAPSFAVIEQPKARRHHLFMAGDVIQDAVIKRILRDKVVLAVNGKDEVLEIEEFRSRPARRRLYRGSNSRPRPATRQRISLSRTRLEKAMGNLNQLMGQARLRPHFRNGKPEGIMISRIRRASIFRQMGMRSGDIITGIDGIPIHSMDDALKLYNDLTTASRAVVQVRRRGRMQTIEYAIE